MARIGINVEGLTDTLQTLTRLDRRDAGTIMTKALGIGARKVRDRARRRDFAFRDDTGRLRKSIKLQLGRKKSDERNFSLFAGGGAAYYGVIVHSRIPFLERAYEEAQDEFFAATVESVSQQLFQATRR